MGFRVSPGVSIKEIDLTTIVPAIATTPGGFAGYFHWGPVNEIITVSSEKDLVNIFGEPKTDNYVDFYTAANFLQYGNSLQLVRVVGDAAANATAKISGVCGANLDINNETEFADPASGSAANTAATNGVLFASKFPGVKGNSLRVVVVDGVGAGTRTTGLTIASALSFGGTVLGLSHGVANTFQFASGDIITFTDGTTNTIVGISATNGSTSVFGEWVGVSGAANTVGLVLGSGIVTAQNANTAFTVRSVYSKHVNTLASTSEYAAAAGGSGDLISVLVFDKDGEWTGTSGTLLEKFEAVSRATDATNTDGSSNYYKTVISERSNLIYALSPELAGVTGKLASSTDWARLTTTGISAARVIGNGVISLNLSGACSAAPNDSERWQIGWSKFADPVAVDVALLPVGNASANLAKLIVNNICEARLDCMAFLSPAQTDVVNKLPYEALTALKTLRDTTININSSYAVLDSGWKYQLDTYNNVVRVMPLNPDIAGLVARTEFTNEAWFSPAGFNRGQIKNVVKLAYNPASEAHRDELYTRQINPVVSFPGEGTVLFGDKTMQSKPSAFDRINVRRLFIILEKAIATASKFFLFEQNDAFTRAQFRNMVVPFLKTVQQRRGITDFKVVCDDTNNPGEIVDSNQFVADIFIKPTRTINFIQLNFIATKTGVSFSEVGG